MAVVLKLFRKAERGEQEATFQRTVGELFAPKFIAGVRIGAAAEAAATAAAATAAAAASAKPTAKPTPASKNATSPHTPRPLLPGPRAGTLQSVPHIRTLVAMPALHGAGASTGTGGGGGGSVYNVALGTGGAATNPAPPSAAAAAATARTFEYALLMERADTSETLLDVIRQRRHAALERHRRRTKGAASASAAAAMATVPVEGAFDPHEWVHMAYRMCRCVQRLHQHGIVHLDIKPAQFIKFPLNWKLVDYGSCVALEVILVFARMRVVLFGRMYARSLSRAPAQ